MNTEEYLDVYRKDGSYCNTILRGTAVPKDGFLKVVSIFTVNSKGEVLLTRRAKGKTYAGKWENTAGMVRSGESILEAAQRELAEETGISCQKEDLIYLDHVFIEDRNLDFYCYLLKKDISVYHLQLQEEETDAAEWRALEYSLVHDTSLAEPVRERFLLFWRVLQRYLSPADYVTPWLSWAKELQSLSQQGVQYTRDPYDKERFTRLSEIACEMLSYKTGLEVQKVTGLFANESGYQTPKVETRAVIFNEAQEILLVREKAVGLWALPGGWCDAGLGIGENCIKECFEEAGLEVSAERLLMVENRSSHDYSPCPFEILKCYIACHVIAGHFSENLETDDARYFSLDELPPLSVERTTKRALEQCFYLFYHPEEGTKFD